MSRPRRSRAAIAAAVAEAVAPTLGALVEHCPNCGGELRFESDRLGYGQTIEQCEHVARCGYWRTLEGPRIQTPAPAKDEPARSANTPPLNSTRGDVMRRKYDRSSQPGELQAAILAVLPASQETALTPRQVAALCGRPTASVVARLFSLWQDGRVHSVKLGTSVTAPRLYWRKDAA